MDNDWVMRATRAEQRADSLSTALIICGAIAGWNIGSWEGFLVFLLFAIIAEAK